MGGKDGALNVIYQRMLDRETDPVRKRKGIQDLAIIEKHLGSAKMIDMLVDADMKAAKETFTGEQLKYLYEFDKSPDGIEYRNKTIAIKREMAFAIADADTPEKAKSLAQLYDGKIERLNAEVQPHFSTGIGGEIFRKRDKYMYKRLRYLQEAKILYKAQAKAVLQKYKAEKKAQKKNMLGH